MMSLNLGPLALPLPPLFLLAALVLASVLARRLAGPAMAAIAEASIGWAAGLGLLAARLAHVLRHAEAYAATPWAVLDVRDGGWTTGVGLAVAGVVLIWHADRHPQLRRALGVAAGSGVLLWSAAHGALVFLQPPASVRDLPAVNLRPLDGPQAPRELAQLLDGRPMVVNLWASWCGPCRIEMPVFAAAQKERPDVRFVFANQGEQPEVVRRYLASQQLALEDVWLDIGSALGPALGSRGLPTTVFFDADGRRVDVHLGLLNAAALRARLARWGGPRAERPPRAPGG